MHYLLFLLLCMVWGTNFILMKKAMPFFDPVDVAVYRVAGGFLALLAVWAMRRERWPIGREYVLPLLFVSLIGYAWPFVVQPTLIQMIQGSGFVGIMVCFVPLLTIVVSIPLLGIYPKPRQLLGVIIGLACSAVILQSGKSQHSVSWWVILLAASVPLFYAICNTYIKRRFVGVKALPLTIAALAFSTAILSPLAIITNGTGLAEADPVEVSATSQSVAASEVAAATETPAWLAIGAVVALGVIGTGLGILIFTKLLQEQGPLFAGMVTYLIPVIALTWGAVDGEKIETVQLVAFAGVLFSVGLVQFGAIDSSEADGLKADGRETPLVTSETAG